MPRILVADDDAAQLELRRLILEAGGHQVSLAIRPGDVLRQLASADLVIMDLRFPNAQGDDDSAEGLTLIRAIRDSGYGGPVMVLSGWPQELEGQPEEHLVSRVMLKPVGMQGLLQAIAELVTASSAPFQNPLSAGQ
jgi:CheY-like chemotaxis protein